MSNEDRKTSLGWLIVPFAMLTLAGCQEHKSMKQEDARQTLQQLKDANAGQGRMIQPGADAGPIARLTAGIANMMLADNRAFSEAASQAGLAQVIWLEGLTTSSPVLDHCERIDALGARARALGARFPVYIQAVRSEGGKLVASGDMPQRELDGMIYGMGRQQQAFNRQWTVGGELADHAGQLCRILARRRWTSSDNGELHFTNSGDRAEATALRAKLAPLMTEITAIGDNARATSGEAMRQLEDIGAR
jgi:hypothetical protein